MRHFGSISRSPVAVVVAHFAYFDCAIGAFESRIGALWMLSAHTPAGGCRRLPFGWRTWRTFGRKESGDLKTQNIPALPVERHPDAVTSLLARFINSGQVTSFMKSAVQCPGLKGDRQSGVMSQGRNFGVSRFRFQVNRRALHPANPVTQRLPFVAFVFPGADGARPPSVVLGAGLRLAPAWVRKVGAARGERCSDETNEMLDRIGRCNVIGLLANQLPEGCLPSRPQFAPFRVG